MDRGIVGLFSDNSFYKYIQNCINYGLVIHSGTSTGRLGIGGIIGFSRSTYIQNCLSAGKMSISNVPSENYQGSVVGWVLSNTYINYCYFTSDVEVNYLYSGNSPSSTTGSSTSSPVIVDSTLMTNLNSQATSNGWNKWLLNSNNASVTFKYNDNRGFSVTSQVVLLPDLSTTGSNVFKGWFTNTTYSSIFTSQSVSSAITLYGVYGDVVFVTFYGIDGNVFQERKYVAIGYSYGTLPSVGTRTGYTSGWFTASDGGTQVTNETTVSASSDHTLYARWTPNPYTVKFEGNGADSVSNTEMTVTYDEPYGDLATASRTGYDFDGWFNATVGGTQVTNETTVSTLSDHTLYAHWTPLTFTVKFEGNGATSVSKTSMTVTYDSKYGELATTTRSGYDFDGWFNATVGGTQVTNETTVSTLSDHTLYAQWIPNNYNVYFNANGGGGNVPASKNVNFNSTYGDLPTPSRTGYTFVGWYTETPEGILVTNSTVVTLDYDHTLYAHWDPIQYTISFVSDGESACPNIAQNYDTPITLPVPSKTGYTFICCCNDTELDFEYTAKRLELRNVTLYARWEANNYIVSFDVNGADDEFANKEMSVIFDSPYGTLPVLNKTGHTFSGWTDSLFGGNEVNSSTTVSVPNNHTLYALWTVNKYTMSFVSEGMEPINITLNYNDIITYPNENPSKSFHKFRRWCTIGESGEEECNVTHVPDHDLTFTASFDVDSSLVTGITAVGAFAVVLFIILIIVIVFLIRFTKTVKHKYEVVDVEMDEDLNERNEDIEERIRQQVEATSISTNIKKKLEKPLKKADKSKGVDEILMDLEVDCENAEDISIIDSYRTTNASAVVANTINNEKNLIAAVEYLTILYSSVQGQEEYEKFSELYFGMKNVDDFMNSMDEKTISFGGIVSGFTSKKVAIQSLMSREEEEEITGMPSGVLFRVQNGMGYRIGKVGEETDEVLFELCSSFKVESMKEISRDKYIVVNLSFISPLTKDEMIKI